MKQKFFRDKLNIYIGPQYIKKNKRAYIIFFYITSNFFYHLGLEFPFYLFFFFSSGGDGQE